MLTFIYLGTHTHCIGLIKEKQDLKKSKWNYRGRRESTEKKGMI